MSLKIEFHGGDDKSGDVFVVETKAKAGYKLDQHTHDHPHLSYLVSGTALVAVGDNFIELTGPCSYVIEANKSHTVHAVTDIVWLCLWDAKLGIKDEAIESLKLVKEY